MSASWKEFQGKRIQLISGFKACAPSLEAVTNPHPLGK